MESLPTELLNHICTFLGRSDLATLALTSSHTLQAARWQLYTSITLYSNSPSSAYTYRLLLSDSQLARRTVTLSLETHTDWHINNFAPGYTWFDLGIFKQMERLGAVRFTRLPCRPSDDAKFIDILKLIYKHCQNLTALAIVGFSWPELPTDWVSKHTGNEKLVAHPKLRKVVYSALHTSDKWSALALYLFTPATSIAYLDLFIVDPALFSMLRTLSFPALRTLYLRSVPLQTGASVLASFLVLHPSIYHLYLIDVTPLIPLDKPVMTMLPTLKTIQGTPSLITRLAMRCESIRHIQALVLDYVDAFDHVDDTAALVNAVGGFPNLRHCAILQTITAAHTAEIVRLLAVESVHLTCWTGGFYYRDVAQLKVVADALAAFPALARLDICEWTYPTNPPTPLQHAGLSYVVRHNRRLAMLCLYMTHLPTSEISTVYRVRRLDGAAVQLTETYRCVEGGPYIQERRCVEFAALRWEDEVVLEEH